MSLLALVKAHSVRKLFHFSSVIPTVTVPTGRFVRAHLTLELCKSKPIYLQMQKWFWLILPQGQKSQLEEIGGKKSFLLTVCCWSCLALTVSNCFHKMWHELGALAFGGISITSRFVQALGKKPWEQTAGLGKSFKFAWSKIVSLDFSQNAVTGGDGLRQTAVGSWRDACIVSYPLQLHMYPWNCISGQIWGELFSFCSFGRWDKQFLAYWAFPCLPLYSH